MEMQNTNVLLEKKRKLFTRNKNHGWNPNTWGVLIYVLFSNTFDSKLSADKYLALQGTFIYPPKKKKKLVDDDEDQCLKLKIYFNSKDTRWGQDKEEH